LQKWRNVGIADGFMAIPVSDGGYIYSKTTDESFIKVDFKRNHSQIITWENPWVNPKPEE